MVLFRYLAHAVIISALLSGCSSQSLFEDDNGGNGGPRDGSTKPSAPDSSPDPPDASMMTLPEDGGPDAQDGDAGSPDASVRDLCPKPCAGDAYGDFSLEQGGGNGRWRYVEVRSDKQYVDMTVHQFPNFIFGWQGTEVNPPTIAWCNDDKAVPPCVELDQLVELTSNGQTLHHPALMWIAPEAGYYVLTGTYRVSSVAPPADVTIRITLNEDTNERFSQTVRPRTDPQSFTLELDVMAGDAIVLSMLAATSVSVSVGTDFFITGPYGATPAAPADQRAM
jgi:hypothetical protein